MQDLLSWYIARPNHKGKGRIERWLFRAMNGRFVRSVYGPMMRVRAGDHTNRFCITGALDADYRDVFDEVLTLCPGDGFIDIGANAGLYTLLASDRVGRGGIVIAFEPSISVYDDLVANIRHNGCQPVLPVAAAISTHTAVARFSSGGANHTGVGHLSDLGDTAVVTLGGADLLAMFGTLLEGRRTIIKIDVEGHEARVADAIRPLLAQRFVERVVVEVDPANLARAGSTDTELYAIFADAGFIPRRGQGAADHFNEIFTRR